MKPWSLRPIYIRFAVEASSWSNGSLSWSLHGSIDDLLMLQSSGIRSLWRSVYRITVKKVSGFPVPNRGMSLTKLSLTGNY